MIFQGRVFFEGQRKSRVFHGLPGFSGLVGHPVNACYESAIDNASTRRYKPYERGSMRYDDDM